MVSQIDVTLALKRTQINNNCLQKSNLLSFAGKIMGKCGLRCGKEDLGKGLSYRV
jgi:hypothetical protein